MLPSYLAADVGRLAEAAARVAGAGASWAHVDVGDGSACAGGQLTSLGPSSIAALKAAAPHVKLDVHLYCSEPERHVGAVVAAGADRVTFQLESVLAPSPAAAAAAAAAAREGVGEGQGGLKGEGEGEGEDESDEDAAVVARARRLCEQIRSAGALVGVCIAPGTPVERLRGLLQDQEEKEEEEEKEEGGGAPPPLVDLVDVLAVLPGVGGQPFRRAETLRKVAELRRRFPRGLRNVMVDGGVAPNTAPEAAAAGANVLVSGSFLFGAPSAEDFAGRLAAIEDLLVAHGD